MEFLSAILSLRDFHTASHVAEKMDPLVQLSGWLSGQFGWRGRSF